LFGFFAQQEGSNENIFLISFGAAVEALRAQYLSPVVQNCIIFIMVAKLPQTNLKIFN
jgi:hypothetical protein